MSKRCNIRLWGVVRGGPIANVEMFDPTAFGAREQDAKERADKNDAEIPDIAVEFPQLRTVLVDVQEVTE